MHHRMWGEENILNFTNAIDVPPIFQIIQEVINFIKPILESDSELTTHQVNEIINKLYIFMKCGKYTNDYLQPSQHDLVVTIMILF